MSDSVAILLGAIFVNNFVTVQFLGLCPFLGASRNFEGALGMGAATTFVLTLASAASYLIDTFVLTPLDAGHLRIIAFIFVIASLVQGVGFVLRAAAPVIHAGGIHGKRWLQIRHGKSGRTGIRLDGEGRRLGAKVGGAAAVVHVRQTNIGRNGSARAELVGDDRAH